MEKAVDFLERQAVATGQQLGSKYVLGEQLGRGAMGVVFDATTTDGQDVAVKILRPELSTDPKTVARFVQERQIFSRANHPNVVRVHDMVAEGDRLGIVMERVSGGDLKQRIEAGGFNVAQSLHLTSAIAAGLAEIHAADVVHRDLKPANILLTTTADGTLVPKISDFGISRLVSEAMTRTSTTIGTPLYMAPESADQRGAGPASDIYALGAILFELLIGKPPFHEGGTFAVIRAHALDQPGRIGGVPAALADMVDAMLAKEPSDRPSIDTIRRTIADVLPEIGNHQRPFVTSPLADADHDRAAETIVDGGDPAVGVAAEIVDPSFGGPADPADSADPAGSADPADSAETRVDGLRVVTGPAPGDPSDSSETVFASTLFDQAKTPGRVAGSIQTPAPPTPPTPPGGGFVAGRAATGD